MSGGAPVLLVPAETYASAVVNHGRWLAECPREFCNNAIKLDPGETQFFCGGMDGCRLVAEVRWPADADDIWAALVARPVPGTRNWAPAGHRQAVASGCPDGQSVADLVDENAEHGIGGQ